MSRIGLVIGALLVAYADAPGGGVAPVRLYCAHGASDGGVSSSYSKLNIASVVKLDGATLQAVLRTWELLNAMSADGGATPVGAMSDYDVMIYQKPGMLYVAWHFSRGLGGATFEIDAVTGRVVKVVRGG